MNFPRMRPLLFSLILLCASAGAQNRRHTIPPYQQHGSAQAGLGIQLRVVPVVLPPRHKDRDHDQDRGEAFVIYNLAPSTEKLSLTQATQTMLVEGGQEQVQLTTLVLK